MEKTKYLANLAAEGEKFLDGVSGEENAGLLLIARRGKGIVGLIGHHSTGKLEEAIAQILERDNRIALTVTIALLNVLRDEHKRKIILSQLRAGFGTEQFPEVEKIINEILATQPPETEGK